MTSILQITVLSWLRLPRSAYSSSPVAVLDVEHLVKLFSHLNIKWLNKRIISDEGVSPPVCCPPSRGSPPPQHVGQSLGSTGVGGLRRETCTQSSRTSGTACGGTGTSSSGRCPGTALSSRHNRRASHSNLSAEHLRQNTSQSQLALHHHPLHQPSLSPQLTSFVIQAGASRVG